MQDYFPIMDTTIRVSCDTRDKLIAIGRKGESYDALLQRLIALYQEHKKK